MTEQEREKLRIYYSKNYEQLTGYKLKCIEHIGSPELTMDKLYKIATEVFKIDVLERTRRRENIIARIAVWKIARELNYTQEDIIKDTSWDRSVVSTSLSGKTAKHVECVNRIQQLREHIANLPIVSNA